MKIIRARSLQQRLVIFLLLPLTLLLFGAGFLGFLYARNIMLKQWEEAAILKLQRAAHHIDMRLNWPFQLLEIFNASGGLKNDAEHQKLLFDQLKKLEGVTKVSLEWLVPPEDKEMMPTMRGMMSDMHKGPSMMRFHHDIISNITLPTYDAEAGGETVSLISSLIDDAGRVIGKLNVAVRFDYLMADVFKLGWWQSDMAGLVDQNGKYVTQTENMAEGLKERDLIRNTFGRYVDKEFAQKLLRHPEMADLGGQKREGVILMSDLRGFTPLAETLNPETIIRILNHYFSYMIRVIKQHQGIVVDLVGDMILVFFDPLDGPIQSAAFNAVFCALNMQDEMKKLNDEIRQEKLTNIEMGIGINAGHVVVGNIGSETRAKYSIIGSAVNITDRIQSVAKPGEIIIPDSVYNYVKEEVTVKRSFNSHLKGVKDILKLYEIGTL